MAVTRIIKRIVKLRDANNMKLIYIYIYIYIPRSLLLPGAEDLIHIMQEDSQAAEAV
jgi:hypothetical protein